MTFQTIKISGYQFELSDDFPIEFPAGITDAFKNGQRSSFVKLPSSKFANVYKFNIYLKGKLYNLILKQYLNRSLLDVFKNILFSCRAYKAFKADLMLKQYGFDVPDVAAAGKKTFLGIPVRNFLITNEITDSDPLHIILESNAEKRQEVINQFGQTVGRMHAENIFHGDLRFGNVLVKNNINGFKFIFLDNERTRKFKKLPHRLRLKNLVQIYISRTNASDSEKNCFLDAYLSQQNVKFDKEKLAAEIAAGVKKRLAAKGMIRALVSSWLLELF